MAEQEARTLRVAAVQMESQNGRVQANLERATRFVEQAAEKGAGLVILPERMPAETKIELRMDFKTRAMVKYTNSFIAVSRFGWMPFVRFTDRIDDFEITISAPSKYTVLGIGTMVSEETEGEVTTTHWKARNPVAFPTFIFGDYYVVEPRIKATR